MNQQSGPPFDGTPCPMCPSEIRNLSAVAYNLSNRLRPGAGYSLCEIGDRVGRLREAVAEVTLTAESPAELHDLYRVAGEVAACKTYQAVYALEPQLKVASAAVQMLTDAHFADRRHSYP